MKLTILYNFPLGQDSARVSLGMPNVEDVNYQFRMGIINQGDEDNSGWLNPGWVNHNEMTKLDAYVKKNSKIRVQKKEKNSDSIVNNYEIDCNEKWPDEAVGASVTTVDYLI